MQTGSITEVIKLQKQRNFILNLCFIILLVQFSCNGSNSEPIFLESNEKNIKEAFNWLDQVEPLPYHLQDFLMCLFFNKINRNQIKSLLLFR